MCVFQDLQWQDSISVLGNLGIGDESDPLKPTHKSATSSSNRSTLWEPTVPQKTSTSIQSKHHINSKPSSAKIQNKSSEWDSISLEKLKQ